MALPAARTPHLMRILYGSMFMPFERLNQKNDKAQRRT